MADAPLYGRVAIIGLGLIGSSIARAARRAGGAGTLVAYDQSAFVRARVAELGLADVVADSAAEAAEGADLVIVCTPVGVSGAVAAEIGPRLKVGAVLSDVGSVKGAVVRDMAPHVPAHAVFIPAHPIAGTEDSGPDAGFAELFQGRWTILTPLSRADDAEVERLKAFWTAMGANVDAMSVEHHDLVFAIVSHVPHLIAYNIVGTAADLEEVTQQEVIKYSASGFRDFTRIAASDPTMWRDIFLNNRDAVLEILGRFTEDLQALQRAIRWGEGDALFNLFTRTRAIRRSIVEQGQDTAAPDFGRRPPAKTDAPQ
ncbi:cyclohexadienyl dehydrogenase [Methylopila jiangsuensis]|uniref:prephenate dehydrogenase n=1 Tax=Methylopila jiangsuensis TaxID=586230 RepID=A0A9W6JIT7_9HYPH|nr:prephenate/arogenate dehydrogenase family protein [Methylopila jiangsuensis]MDR6287123.1 cyclohexadieny/prephenate dehydrogenase [Methylopila jiangsuensis]GLK76610.1 cyclohexadienyl dehydrogenase [Methylopila jiangsuensis]